MMLKRDTDYAIQLLVCYGRIGATDDRFVYRREVLRETEVPAEAQSRICRIMCDSGYLKAETNNRELGYRLAVPPEEITLKKILELTENGSDVLSIFDKKSRIYSNNAWDKLQRNLNRNLESITIETFLK